MFKYLFVGWNYVLRREHTRRVPCVSDFVYSTFVSVRQIEYFRRVSVPTYVSVLEYKKRTEVRIECAQLSRFESAINVLTWNEVIEFKCVFRERDAVDPRYTIAISVRDFHSQRRCLRRYTTYRVNLTTWPQPPIDCLAAIIAVGADALQMVLDFFVCQC